jgi:hypothetical protein
MNLKSRPIAKRLQHLGNGKYTSHNIALWGDAVSRESLPLAMDRLSGFDKLLIRLENEAYFTNDQHFQHLSEMLAGLTDQYEIEKQLDLYESLLGL